MKKQSHTCISVIKTKSGKLIMAGDRRSSFGWDRAEVMDRPKISAIKNGERKNAKGKLYNSGDILLGATGSGSLCTLLVDVLQVPDIDTDSDTYMFFKFKEAIFKLLVNQNYTDKDKNLHIPPDMAVELVVGLQGTVYTVNIDNPYSTDSVAKGGLIQIDVVSTPYATGCGGASALPILLANKKLKGYNTREDLKLAMEIAADISPGCDNEIDYRSED